MCCAGTPAIIYGLLHRLNISFIIFLFRREGGGVLPAFPVYSGFLHDPWTCDLIGQGSLCAGQFVLSDWLASCPGRSLPHACSLWLWAHCSPALDGWIKWFLFDIFNDDVSVTQLIWLLSEDSMACSFQYLIHSLWSLFTFIVIIKNVKCSYVSKISKL